MTVEISIHALVKRATIMISTKNIGKMISIHALVKRATTLCGFISTIDVFQSTPS